MREAARRPAALVLLALVLAALTLALPWALAFDPWSWLVWGRDVTRLELDTSGGPSWKPLPVVATTVLAAAGGLAPALWLVLARAAGLLAVAGAAALALRLADDNGARPVRHAEDRWAAPKAAPADDEGVRPLCHAVPAAVAAGGAVVASEWWLLNTALGNSEGLLAAAVLWAAVAHLAGRPRVALACGVAAALLRPEAWPFLGLYALWLWRGACVRPVPLAVALAPVPLLWFGPDLLGTGGALGASSAARGPASPQSAIYADVPGLEVLTDFAGLLTVPVLLAAVAGTVVGGRAVRVLAAGAAGWVLLVAVMTQAGYAGNPRYNVAAAAVGCVVAGVGVAALAARVASRLAWAAAVALPAAVLAFTAGTLADQADELGARADRRTQLDALVDRAGGAQAIRACGSIRTNQPMKAMLAWRLDVPMATLADPPRRPGAVFSVPPGYAGEPATPTVEPGFQPVARVGEWLLVASCEGGY